VRSAVGLQLPEQARADVDRTHAGVGLRPAHVNLASGEVDVLDIELAELGHAQAG
jgi:hypothetical protein